jgi:hypothetical protein
MDLIIAGRAANDHDSSKYRQCQNYHSGRYIQCRSCQYRNYQSDFSYYLRTQKAQPGQNDYCKRQEKGQTESIRCSEVISGCPENRIEKAYRQNQCQAKPASWTNEQPVGFGINWQWASFRHAPILPAACNFGMVQATLVGKPKSLLIDELNRPNSAHFYKQYGDRAEESAINKISYGREILRLRQKRIAPFLRESSPDVKGTASVLKAHVQRLLSRLDILFSIRNLDIIGHRL